MIAKNILKQLGENKFLSMIGAYNLMDHKDALSFRIPNNPSKINYVKITLRPCDTYTLTFGRVYGMNYKTIHSLENIYNHQLINIFEKYTGLKTSL